MQIIGHVSSPYKEKFSIPRQPNLVQHAKGYIEFLPDFSDIDMLCGIEAYSHLWLVFIFHQTAEQGWKAKVRPQRLGGNKKMGVLATRSTFRPNPIGLSCVAFDKVEKLKNGKVRLHIEGLDLVDGTPIVDIKPYVPYADVISQATSAFAAEAPVSKMNVEFAEALTDKLVICEQKYSNFKQFVIQVLAQDPRPVYKQGKADNKMYGVKLVYWNLQFKIEGDKCMVYSIEDI
ncbi:tRNA (N6-threonylcarbamoyladenosine(37)-N6)-methyltransferase TrmO [Catenovulum agarivorans]|uniref:tRNA (N6-threonylcarbamoyladenosine(37)-N6)-methyltransferase TrmO n=1 Tax=Catenovulum agarivorans TaxID=1172192 RepID=UPI0002FDFB59|nr:tRNA (N6-threonylcarbamoyladenosine(37)-N6)-methyltransferase TrmO [Catenovulum agarivorans]